MKLPETLALHKTSTFISTMLFCTSTTHDTCVRCGRAQQARGSGTVNRLVTGPQLPETFRDAKRQDNLAIMGLAFTILGTIANCLQALSSHVP